MIFLYIVNILKFILLMNRKCFIHRVITKQALQRILGFPRRQNPPSNNLAGRIVQGFQLTHWATTPDLKNLTVAKSVRQRCQNMQNVIGLRETVKRCNKIFLLMKKLS